MINFTLSDRDEAVSLANAILREGGLDCAVYSLTDEPGCFMVLDKGAAAAFTPDEIMLEHNPERRRWVRVPFNVPVTVVAIEPAHA